MTLADGTEFSPQALESRLKFSPYVKEAVVIGQGKPFLAALISIDGRIVGKWAGDNKLTYTTYSDLAAKPEVYDLIQRELATVNEMLPEANRLRMFTLLYKELDADEGEITRSGKLCRAVVADRYEEVIQAVYGGAGSLVVDKTIDLQDGKSARIQTTIMLRNLTTRG
jgi:long-chain acyl-CoA synthetase